MIILSTHSPFRYLHITSRVIILALLVLSLLLVLSGQVHMSPSRLSSTKNRIKRYLWSTGKLFKFFYARNRYNAGHHPYLHKHDRSFYDEDTIWLILESWKIEECNGFEQKFLFNRNFVENIPQIQKCTSLSPEIQANNQQKHGNKLSKNLQTVISLTSWLFSKQSKISTRPNNWYVKRNSYINLFYAVIANFISLVLCYIVMIKNSSKKCFFFIEY